MSKRVIVTGATGFIGRSLIRRIFEENDEVVALTRRSSGAAHLFPEGVKVVRWDGADDKGWAKLADGAFAIVNLAGENISAGHWNDQKKKQILASRVEAAAAVVSAVKRAKRKPRVVIQASAVGYYGSRGNDILDEESKPGTGFLAGVCRSWEDASAELRDLGVRLVVIRSGVVFGRGGGAFEHLVMPFRLHVGAIPGGKQWLSWIHLNDEVEAIRFLLEHEEAEGVFNITSPAPRRMKDICKLLGRTMHRSSWLHVPRSVLHALVGEMADEVLLASQRAVPKRLEKAGYRFLFPDAEAAIDDLLSEAK